NFLSQGDLSLERTVVELGVDVARCRPICAMTGADWQAALPTLTSRTVTLREVAAHDVSALVDLLSIADASRFGLEYPVTELAVHQFIERAQRERAAGLAFTYAVLVNAGRTFAGALQVRRLD